ncbi:MAG: phosphatidate cytidylyltransferase [Firmicutes bacterium]|nr:phosphatidate cytidylyltransferase [Bacillota bacterium]MDD4693952.1 phosphatidate cytidylyltransferase [Bacillota bacterium]
MWTRILTAIVGIPLLLVLAYLGGWWFFTLALVASIVALYEFHGFAKGLGSNLNLFNLIAGGIATFLLTYFRPFNLPAVIVCFIVLIILELFHSRSVLKNGSLMILGSIYGGSLFAFLPLLRDLGFQYVILLLLITWGSDTLAYFWGIKYGKNKLWPAVSPKKSWEGAFGGLLGGFLGGLVSSLFGVVPLVIGGLLGLFGSVIAQTGDLLESAMKRECGVKDSGDILPGHGGILDRFDSLLILAPFLYLVINYTLR